MAFEPRLTDEILSDLAAKVITRSNLSDLSKGSAVLSILGAFAEELSGIEFRLKQIRDSFTLTSASGSDLDERVADLPAGGIVRLGPAPASGGVLKITRSGSTVAALIVPAGTTYSRSDDPTLEYVQQTDVTIGIGQTTYPALATDANIPVTCNVFGPAGNCDAGTIDVVRSAPAEVVTVAQVTALTSGVDRETDVSLRQRGTAFIAGLARCNLKSIEAMCRSFVSSGGIQIRHAALFEDPERPGITYVTVDDGTGFEGFEKSGIETSGTIPAGTSAPTILYHENPATEAISNTQFQIKAVGAAAFSPAPLNDDGSPRWTSVYERGIIYPEDGLLSAGDEWRISGYKVYTGPISEMQGIIEGDPSNPVSEPGYRPVGTRVIVSTANITYIASIQVNIAIATGSVFTDVSDDLKTAIVDYFKTLAPGEAFHKPLLYQHLLNGFDEVVTIDIIEPAATTYPVTYDHALRVKLENVKVL